MKQFNLEEYLRLKEGGNEPRIVTRGGEKPVRIVCTDVACSDGCPILALVKETSGEFANSYKSNGYLIDNSNESCYDLFFADLNEDPKYRPFKDAEEFFSEMKKHGEWILDNKGLYVKPLEIWNDKIFLFNRVASWSFADMVKEAIWADDGSVCGKLIEE